MHQSCKYCGRLHPIGYECPKKPPKRKHNTDAVRFRNTKAWARKRAEVNERDHYLCRLCLEERQVTSHGLETHHIIPLEEDIAYALEDDYLITLCVDHHKAADRGIYERDYLMRLAREAIKVSPLGEAP